jgi:hypothetical protein
MGHRDAALIQAMTQSQCRAPVAKDLTKARVFEILPRAGAKLAGSASAQCAQDNARRWYRYSQQRSSMFPDLSHAGQRANNRLNYPETFF